MRKIIFFSSIIFLLFIFIVLILIGGEDESESEEDAYLEESYEYEEVAGEFEDIVEEKIDDGRIPIPKEDGNGNIEIEAFFLKGEPGECGKVYGLRRSVSVTKKAPRDSLIELFNGVSEEEEEDGYYTLIDDDVSVQGMSVQHGVAFVDVNPEIEEEIEENCQVKAIRDQIEKTLMQFSGINEVQLYVGGKDKNIFQR